MPKLAPSLPTRAALEAGLMDVSAKLEAGVEDGCAKLGASLPTRAALEAALVDVSAKLEAGVFIPTRAALVDVSAKLEALVTDLADRAAAEYPAVANCVQSTSGFRRDSINSVTYPDSPISEPPPLSLAEQQVYALGQGRRSQRRSLRPISSEWQLELHDSSPREGASPLVSHSTPKTNESGPDVLAWSGLGDRMAVDGKAIRAPSVVASPPFSIGKRSSSSEEERLLELLEGDGDDAEIAEELRRSMQIAY